MFSSTRYFPLVKYLQNWISNGRPLFIVPLPREKGFEIMFTQWNSNNWFITTLAEYKEKGPGADPIIELQFFTELLEKNVVLMKGEIKTKQLKVLEVQMLVNQLQIFYNNEQV